ncbi:MAG: MATE family efflux transporter [Chloroflexi bacterium]|nr:MATE family efflux transporter [Chloroflexota bacterium]
MALQTDAAAVFVAPALDLSGKRMSRIIFRLAWPVVVERLSISVLSAVDAALVGRYVGAEGLAAVGIGALLFWVPLSGAVALDVASTAVVARDVGAGDRSRVAQGLATAITMALIWGIACSILVFAGAPWLIRTMGGRGDVVPLGVTYLRAGSLGFPLLMLFYAVSGSLRGMGNTWMPMLILLVVNLVNAVVTYLLISGTVADLGIQASGIGYAGAGIAGGGLALLLALSGAAPVRFEPRRVLTITRDSLGRLLHIGLPVGLEEAQFMLAFIVYTRIVAYLGTQQLAAHALALRSLEIAILPGFALGTAATALIGQYLGAGRPQLAEAFALRVRNIAFGIMLTMAVIQFTLAPWIVRIFVDDPEVVSTGTRLLRVFALALPAMGLHAPLSGALRGGGDVRYVLGTFTFTSWGIRVPVAALLVFGFGLSVPFAWAAAVAENWVRAALISRRFRSGRWKHLHV